MLNKVMLIGRITRDLEIRKTRENLSVLNFTLVCNSSGSKDSEPDYINCVAWREQADYLGMYAGKGDLIYAEGAMKTRKYEKGGNTYYTTEVQCRDVKILVRKKKEEVPSFSPAEPEDSADEDYEDYTDEGETKLF